MELNLIKCVTVHHQMYIYFFHFTTNCLAIKVIKCYSSIIRKVTVSAKPKPMPIHTLNRRKALLSLVSNNVNCTNPITVTITRMNCN